MSDAEIWAPLNLPKLEDRVGQLTIDGKSWRIPKSAMGSRTFRFVIPSDAPGQITYHADLGLPAIVYARPGAIPMELRPSGEVVKLPPVASLPSVILDDGTSVALEPLEART